MGASAIGACDVGKERVGDLFGGLDGAHVSEPRQLEEGALRLWGAESAREGLGGFEGQAAVVFCADDEGRAGDLADAFVEVGGAEDFTALGVAFVCSCSEVVADRTTHARMLGAGVGGEPAFKGGVEEAFSSLFTYSFGFSRPLVEGQSRGPRTHDCD